MAGGGGVNLPVEQYDPGRGRHRAAAGNPEPPPPPPPPGKQSRSGRRPTVRCVFKGHAMEQRPFPLGESINPARPAGWSGGPGGEQPETLRELE